MSDYAHPEALIDTQWLADHLNDPAIRIVEVDMSQEPYTNGHIPGAVFWNIFSDLLQPDLSMNLEPNAIASLLSRSCITEDTIVIAYGSYPGTGAWIFWLLRTLGHQNVLVLNGGYQKWVAEGRPLAAKLSNFPETKYPKPTPNFALRVTHPEVQAAIEQSEQTLLDVQTPEEYRGEVFLMGSPQRQEQAGHISGAVYLEHASTLNEDGTFKSVKELRSLYESRGIAANQEIFPYCAIGGRSACT
ncbi:Thiosulfate sulfurtransferase [Acaryochloris thomasi RCC1774]|uniref:thiosulfate sulfurtransferase n=1 Tax=Acaryochloris thomasi RCC1774 TaxID=1764569 RepID=A0A2W1JN30_9CYAN|nr:rhodanese-like domain-containing protein [Acaryochloris thomasi]PZD74728.1 Thiosulfate sulfurtransferase [Acaryochloris thomasi RCC1774]